MANSVYNININMLHEYFFCFLASYVHNLTAYRFNNPYSTSYLFYSPNDEYIIIGTYNRVILLVDTSIRVLYDCLTKVSYLSRDCPNLKSNLSSRRYQRTNPYKIQHQIPIKKFMKISNHIFYFVIGLTNVIKDNTIKTNKNMYEIYLKKSCSNHAFHDFN